MNSSLFTEFKIADVLFQQSNLISYTSSKSDEDGYCLLLIGDALCFFDLQGSLISKIPISPHIIYLGSLSDNLSFFVLGEDKHKPHVLAFDHANYSFESILSLDFLCVDIFEYPFYAARNGLTNLSLLCHPSLHGSILHYFNCFDSFIGHSRLTISSLYSDLDFSRIILFLDLFPSLTIYDVYSYGSRLMISATDNSLFFPSNKTSSYVFYMDDACNLVLLFGHDIHDSKFNIYESAFSHLLDVPLWPFFCSSFLEFFDCFFVIHSYNQTHSTLVFFNPITFDCQVKKAWSHRSEFSLLPFCLSSIDFSTKVLYRSAVNPLSFFELNFQSLFSL